MAAAGCHGERVSESISDGVAVAAWRRQRGEFPHSGNIFRPVEGRRVAWMGQCLDDSGDKSPDAIDLLTSRAPFDAVAALNGPFAAAVVETNPRTVSIWTDRHRHYPVYLCRNGDVSVAGTELRCVAPWLSAPKLDAAAVDLFLRTGEIIGRATLLAGVEVLPGGTCLRDEDGRRTEHQYWEFRFHPDHSLSLRECAVELGRRLTASVRRIESVSPRLGVPLSGGLDSRLILGLCEKPNEVPSFTWGLPGCRDVRYAAAFAAAVSSPHQVYFWDPRAFVPLWPTGIDLSAGGFGVHEMFVLPFVGLLAQHCDVILNGLAGDALLGGNFLKWSWLYQHDHAALADMTWRWRVTPEQDEWASKLLCGVAAPTTGRERWVRSLRRRANGRPIEDLNEWLFENRVFRFTNCGTMLLRGDVESHSPFFDRDVVDFVLRVPLEYKVKHRLYLETLKHACPIATRVSWQRTAIRPRWGFWANLAAMAVQRGFRNVLMPFKIEPFPRMAVADPGGWFRHDWRAPTERIMLSDRALGRGLFDADAVRGLWGAHQRGANLTRQIGVLVTIELFCRTVIDGESNPALEQNQ